jgi:hypothetical protein
LRYFFDNSNKDKNENELRNEKNNNLLKDSKNRKEKLNNEIILLTEKNKKLKIENEKHGNANKDQINSNLNNLMK